jgi:hypothetical protein
MLSSRAIPERKTMDTKPSSWQHEQGTRLVYQSSVASPSVKAEKDGENDHQLIQNQTHN